MNGYCDCGRRWTGNSEAHCPTCHEHFSSDQAFTAHLSGPSVDDPLCYPPAEVARKDGSPYFDQIERAHGLVWRRRRDEEHPFSAGQAFSDAPNRTEKSRSSTDVTKAAV